MIPGMYRSWREVGRAALAGIAINAVFFATIYAGYVLGGKLWP